jgi:phosphodiesterase/alkaline phosphatase D-like protein
VGGRPRPVVPAHRATAVSDPPPGFHLNEGRYIEADAWDNYAAERREILGGLAEAQVPNVVVTAAFCRLSLRHGAVRDDRTSGVRASATPWSPGPRRGAVRWRRAGG